MIKLLFALTFLASIPFGVLSLNQSAPLGWASVNANGQNGTTGGAGGSVVIANNQAELITFASSNQPLIIQIPHMITITPKGRYIDVNSNKTIIGVGAGAGLNQGGFRVTNNRRNIIFNNLIIQDTFVEGDWGGTTQDWDGIQIRGSAHHIWIHKCTFLRQGDGAIEFIHGSDYITVSYCLFGANNKVSLISNTDTDTFTDRYRVTMHHNWFNETTQRHPRVRFGRVHLFNNFFFNMGGYGRAMDFANSNGYGIGVGVGSQIYSENNSFERCVNPSKIYDVQGLPLGFIIDIGSHFVQSGTMVTRPSGISWNPADHYTYTLDAAADVKAIVMANAGASHSPTNIATDPALPDVFLSNFPNPFSNYTTLSFRIPEAGIAKIALFDTTGRQVEIISNSAFPEGLNTIKFNRGTLRSGIYFISLHFKGFNKTTKAIIN